MELFERIKTLLFNPKEEWTIIEAENAHHSKVVVGHLLILALIPAVAIFVNHYWTWTEALAKATEPYSRNGVISPEIIERIKAQFPFDAKMGIIWAVQQLILILGGAYIAAVVINALSDQFGSAKDFDRTFSLVAYSYTPLCIAGILYIYNPFAWLVPYAGLYGLYLLYTGLDIQLKPPAEKRTVCFIISLIAVIAVWVILSKIIPQITASILADRKSVV